MKIQDLLMIMTKIWHISLQTKQLLLFRYYLKNTVGFTFHLCYIIQTYEQYWLLKLCKLEAFVFCLKSIKLHVITKLFFKIQINLLVFAALYVNIWSQFRSRFATLIESNAYNCRCMDGFHFFENFLQKYSSNFAYFLPQFCQCPPNQFKTLFLSSLPAL